MMVVRRPKPKEKLAPVEPKPIDNGQIVELAKPEVNEKPKDADYLAEENHKVEEESASKNLGSMAPTYFVSVAAIVAAFYGKSAYEKKNK